MEDINSHYIKQSPNLSFHSSIVFSFLNLNIKTTDIHSSNSTHCLKQMWIGLLRLL